jgi:hypothetical protein
MTTYYRLSSSDFDVWMNQRIWIRNDAKEVRKHYIYEMAHQLTAWMKSYGYTMDSRWHNGRTVLANWLYRICVRTKVGAQKQLNSSNIIGEIYHSNQTEDMVRFNMTIGAQGIEEFLEDWKMVEDLDPECPMGQAVQSELEMLLWSYLDFDCDEESGDEATEVTQRGAKVDEYLQDAAEGFHGGKGSKV